MKTEPHRQELDPADAVELKDESAAPPEHAGQKR